MPDDVMRTAPTLVLVVEDDARSARMLAQLLRTDGFDVDVAFDGAAAIGRLTRGRAPDVLVTDYRMAHVDGLAVAAFARSKQPQIPVIVVTGYPDLVERIARSLDPAATVLVKPAPYLAVRDAVTSAGAKRGTADCEKRTA